ncbi:MAG: hypothetical protein JSU87_17295 [Gemmatimonadota bacterium]|nr:MAG: hypothetical protein JSU87_17295 [Gemmatimonadota bacterium]
MLTLRRTLVLGLALGLLGCESNSDSPVGDDLLTNPQLGINGAPRPFIVDLQPLNGSGVSGTAHLLLDGGTLTVTIDATGLEADRTHAQHIHGNPPARGVPSNSTCPPPSADTDGDGLVSVGEGFPYYGPVLRGLTPFTTAPGGVIDFEATYTGAELDNLDPADALQNRTIVLHGKTVDGNYIGSLPVACGQIRPEPRGPSS